MSEEESIAIQETHAQGYCHIEKISLEKIPPFNAEEKLSKAISIRGVHFKFGHMFTTRFVGATMQQSFHFSIECIPRIQDKNWQCATKSRFSIYELNANGEEIFYFDRKSKYSLFSDDAEKTHFSNSKFTIEALLERFPNKEFIARIQFSVDTPTGLQYCLHMDTALWFEDERVLVNKKLLSAHSTVFSRYFEDDNFHKLGIGSADHFRILYQLMEFGKCDQLDEDTVPQVIQLANMFSIDKVESLCLQFVNRRGSKMTFPEKFKILDTISADAGKRSAVKRAKQEIGGSPTKYFRGLSAAKRLSFQDIEEIGRILAEP